jgi:hypothetical protein
MTNEPSRTVLTGEAFGGPLSGQTLQTSYPKGIILVDRPKGVAWVYDWNDGRFTARSDQPSPLEWRQSEKFNVRRAMEENNYEVRAHPLAGGEY